MLFHDINKINNSEKVLGECLDPRLLGKILAGVFFVSGEIGVELI